MAWLRWGISRSGGTQLLYWSTRLGIIFFCPIFISDIGLYRFYAQQVVQQHQLIYRDFPFEYPPLAFLLIYLPGLVLHFTGGDTEENYRVLFALFLLCFDHWVFRAHLRQDPSGCRALLYTLLTAALPYLIFDRLDIAVGFAVAYPFLAGPAGTPYQPLQAAWAWGLGGAYKLVPLLLAPVAFLERGLPWVSRGLLALASALPLLFSLALTLVLGQGSVPFLSHHSGRGVQIESIYGSAIYFAKAWLGCFAEAGYANNFGAQHIDGLPWLKPVAAGAFFLAMGISVPAVLLARWRGRLSAAAAAWILMLTLVCFSYVLSPQFLFWLIPLAPLVFSELRGEWRRPWFALLLGVVALTAWHFPFYWQYARLNPPFVLALLLRNLFLLLLLAMSWLGFWSEPGEAGAAEGAGEARAVGQD